MTDTTTHDLALARAERDAWQTTCEELHHQIARLTVEAETYRNDIDAADQRVRTIDAALAHEREAGRGLVAQVEALRAESRHHAAIAAQNATISNERDAASARAEKAEADRDRIKREGENRLAYEIELRELHKRGAVQAEEERDAANAEIAKLRTEVAELRARPVLTVEAAVAAAREADWSSAERHDAETVVEAILAALGPVTLPSPDFAQVKGAAALLRKIAKVGALAQGGEQSPNAAECIDAAREIEAALAKLSPAPAPSIDASLLRRILSATKHGPGGKGGNGPCDAACVKCEAERMLADATAQESAPTLRATAAKGG